MSKPHRFKFQGTRFEYDVIFSKRRRTIGLEIHRDHRVLIRVPAGTPQHEIESVVAQKANWIIRKLNDFAENPPLPERQYCDGEAHYFAGNIYKLVVQRAYKPRVELDDNFMILSVKDPNNVAEKAETLKAWYRAQATAIFGERLAECYQLVAHLGVPYPKVYVREMKTRWGSCSGVYDRINLNTRLSQLPVDLIDYVIVHELCHFVEHNHSAAYYDVLSSVMPDWKERRERLKQSRVH